MIKFNFNINKSLTRQILLLMIMMLVLVLASFIITNEIAKNIIEDKASDSMEKILFQVEDKILSFCTDMEGIGTALIYSPTIQTYMGEEDTLTKILMNNDVVSVFANTVSLKENIKGIEIYDSKGIMITSAGLRSGTKAINHAFTSTIYSGVVKLSNGDRYKSYYTISMPIYNLRNNIVKDYIGVCIFVMDASNFTKILDNSLIIDTAKLLLLDQDNKILASGGKTNFDTFNISEWGKNKRYIIQTLTIPRTGWKIVSVIPKVDLLKDMDVIKRWNIVSYLIITGIVCVFLFIFFIHILKPVRELINFMNSYPSKIEKSRFNVKHQNEIGVLGINLNKMLDDIDELNSKIQLTQKRIYEIEIAKKQMEIASYRNQINPHFLYNTLECIRAMALYYKVQEIADISASLSKIFRYSVKGEDFVTVADEISHVREYAKIIGFRFKGRIRVQIEADEDVFPIKMIKMVLQPIVENAVFHGLEKKLGDGLVTVEAKKGQEYIQFVISDNGCGIEEEKLKRLSSLFEQNEIQDLTGSEKSYGIGIFNIYKRLKLFYGSKASINIQSELNVGTIVNIIIPINIQEEY